MDVKFLATNASSAAYLFLVDSATRDLTFHPDANEYIVRFNAPFENVVGVDLVDASVPRTEYVIESGENTLAFTYDSQGRALTVVVPPGDYNLAQLVETLRSLLPAGFTVVASSAPAEISNRVSFTGIKPFTIDVGASTIRRSLGLGVRGVLTSSPGSLRSVVTLLAGDLPTTRVTAAVTPTSSVRQVFAATASGKPVAARLFAQNAGPSSVDVTVSVHRLDTDAVICSGDTTVRPADFQQLDVTLAAGTGVPDVTDGTQYYVRVSSVSSVGAGVRVYVAGSDPDTFGGGGGGSWSGGTDAVCVTLTMEATGSVLDAPNLVDLTGERYLCVRCPEVESHMYRDRAYETMHAGLGMVKLGGYGTRDQRYDYVSVPSRRLRTPLAKMRTLTIRLEKADGTLYSTKGVDHHLLLSVHYLEMSGQPAMARPPLCPDYQPNPTVPWRK